MREIGKRPAVSSLRPALLRPALALACAALPMLSGTCSTAGARGPRVSPADTFHGQITAATGKFKGARGAVTIYIAAPHSATATRRLVLTLVGKRCSRARHCVSLTGAPTGTLTKRRSLPDLPGDFVIRATGSVKPLGTISASGSVTGVGFVAKGYERLRLTLKSPRGRITLTASSGPYSGFTSP